MFFRKLREITKMADSEGGLVFKAYTPVITSPRVIIPGDVSNLLGVLEKKYGKNEFAILFKGEWTKEGFVIDHTDYYVPEQDVSPVFIRIKEDTIALRERGYIAIIHRHPPGARFFSPTDFEYINSDFPVSVLYVNKEFPLATLLLKSAGTYLIIKAEVVVR